MPPERAILPFRLWRASHGDDVGPRRNRLEINQSISIPASRCRCVPYTRGCVVHFHCNSSNSKPPLSLSLSLTLSLFFPSRTSDHGTSLTFTDHPLSFSSSSSSSSSSFSPSSSSSYSSPSLPPFTRHRSLLRFLAPTKRV